MRPLTSLLPGLLLALGVLELVDALLIEGWPFAVAFGVLFLLAAWLVRGGRVLAGTALGAGLATFEVVGFAGWDKNDAVDWAIAVATLVLSVAALAVTAGLLLRRRTSTRLGEQP
jgi:hypothetical protein